jgi:hypothetical protein
LAFLLFVKGKIPSLNVLFVLLAPVTAPYFFVRADSGSSLQKKTMFVTLFYLCFTVVCGVEIHLFIQEKERLTVAAYSSLQRGKIHLGDKLKSSTRAFDLSIRDLECLSKTVSTRSKISQTLLSIETVRKRMIESQKDIDQFLSFAKDYKNSLQDEGFSDFLFVEEFFTSPAVRLYPKSLESYLVAFENLLIYTFDNFESINSKSPPHLKNYDAYYMKYRRAVDKHNLFYAKRIEFQNTLLKKHPGLEQYLPEIKGTDFLKGWE